MVGEGNEAQPALIFHSRFYLKPVVKIIFTADSGHDGWLCEAWLQAHGG